MPEWSIDASAEDETFPDSLLAEIEAVALWTLSSEGAPDTELSIALVGDVTIASLNEQYLSHTGPTDVISFPLDDTGGRLVGDVYIGVAQAERQAAELGIPLREELLRLTIHGTLHVLGWDHPEGEGSGMYARQEEILGSFEF